MCDAGSLHFQSSMEHAHVASHIRSDKRCTKQRPTRMCAISGRLADSSLPQSRLTLEDGFPTGAPKWGSITPINTDQHHHTSTDPRARGPVRWCSGRRDHAHRFFGRYAVTNGSDVGEIRCEGSFFCKWGRPQAWLLDTNHEFWMTKAPSGSFLFVRMGLVVCRFHLGLLLRPKGNPRKSKSNC